MSLPTTRSPGTRTAWLASLALAFVFLAGCAATPPKTTLRAEDTLLGRRLFDSEQAFIYASSERAANEAGASLATAIRDYQKATGRTVPGKGLIVVTDKTDPPYADRMTVLEMGRKLEDMQQFRGPQPLPAGLQQKFAEAEKEVGPETLDRLFLSKPGTADMPEVILMWSLADRPAAGAAWVLAVPTNDFAQDAMRTMIRAAMAKKEVGVLQKALVLPLMGLIEAKAREAAEADRLVAVYFMMTLHDPALDGPAKETVFQKYQKRKEQDVTQGMPTGPNKPATQPATSAPATRSAE